MAQTGYTPISIYYSATTTNVPTAGNLVAGELAINTADGKLFYKDSSGVVQTLATKGGVGSSTTTQVIYNSSGSLAGSANMVFDGSTLTTLNSAYTGTLTGGTGVVNLGSGQFYKNSSGNVGIGTTTPNTKLVPLSSTGVPLSSYTNTSAVFQGAYGVGNGGAIGFDCASNSTNYPTGIGYVVTNNAGYTLGDMVFGTRSVTTDTAPTERMRIDSSGNVGIGTSSPSTIFSGCRLVVVNTSAAGTYFYGGASSDGGARGLSFTSADNGIFLGAIHTIQATSASGIIKMIAGSGGVQLSTGATSWTAISDERKKDIIEPITDAITKVETLRTVIGKYKTDEEGTRRSFLIAQDVQAVLPEAVDATDKDDLGIRYTEVIPLLIAAIKEQQALITNLTTRLTALENK